MRFGVLSRKINEKYPGIEIKLSHDNINIFCCEILEDVPRKYSENKLYIVWGTVFLKCIENCPKTTSFFVVGAGSKTFGGNTFFCNAAQTDLWEIKEQLDELFACDARINQFLRELYHCLDLEDYAGELLKRASEMLGNPIICYNHKHHVQAYQLEDSEQHRYLQKDLDIGYYKLDNEALRGEFEKMAEDGQYFQIKIKGHQVIVWPIMRSYILAGYLVVWDLGRSFRDLDYKVLKTVASVIRNKNEKKMMLRRKNEQRYRQVIEMLLDEKAGSQDDLDAWLKASAWTPRKYNQVILIDVQHKSPEEVGRYAERIEEIIRDAKVMHHKQYLFALQEFHSKPAEAFKGELAAVLEHYHLRAGGSELFESLMDISNAYEQARGALRAADVMDITDTVVMYTDIRHIDFMLRCAAIPEKEKYFHPLVKILREYDALHGTALSETLFYYLLNERSVQKTAEKMNIHRNTITYRINKIKELYSGNGRVSFDERIFHLLLSLWLQEISGRIDRHRPAHGQR